MELIERYLYAVSRALPKSQREEVEKELRSDIEDMVENETGPKEKRVRKVLETLGRPETLAQQYSGTKRYLIGPKWFSAYIDTLKKVAIIAFPLFIVLQLVILGLDQEITTIGTAIGATITAAISVIPQVLFWVTAVFVFLEHMPNAGSVSQEWTVDQLPELPVERQVKLSDSIANMVFYGFMTVLVLLAASLLGARDATGGIAPFFSPGLWSFWLPIMVVLLTALAVKEAFIVKAGRPTVGLVTTGVVVNGLLTGILVWLYSQGQLVNPAFASHAQAAMGPVSLDLIVTITVIGFVAGFLWDAVASLVRLSRYKK